MLTVEQLRGFSSLVRTLHGGVANLRYLLLEGKGTDTRQYLGRIQSETATVRELFFATMVDGHGSEQLIARVARDAKDATLRGLLSRMEPGKAYVSPEMMADFFYMHQTSAHTFVRRAASELLKACERPILAPVGPTHIGGVDFEFLTCAILVDRVRGLASWDPGDLRETLGPKRDKVGEAMAWLRQELSHGNWVLSTEIQEKALSAGISKRTFIRAKDELHVQNRKQRGPNGQWEILLPPEERHPFPVESVGNVGTLGNLLDDSAVAESDEECQLCQFCHQVHDGACPDGDF